MDKTPEERFAALEHAVTNLSAIVEARTGKYPEEQMNPNVKVWGGEIHQWVKTLD
jgi:hypothetical protein